MCITPDVEGDLDEAIKRCEIDEYSQLFAKGIKLLAMREHSVQELVVKLSNRCQASELVSAVADELIQKNYLSDQRFTESYVRSKQNKGFGPNKIINDLIYKGIKNRAIYNYINVNSYLWNKIAQEQYLKKYGREPIQDYATWAKRARFMQSRGFTMEHIQMALPSIDLLTRQ